MEPQQLVPDASQAEKQRGCEAFIHIARSPRAAPARSRHELRRVSIAPLAQVFTTEAIAGAAQQLDASKIAAAQVVLSRGTILERGDGRDGGVDLVEQRVIASMLAKLHPGAS
jgi:hypothetical protein